MYSSTSIVFLYLDEYTNGFSEPKLLPGFECVETQWELSALSALLSNLTRGLCLLPQREKYETFILELVCLNKQRYSIFCLKEILS